MYTCTRYGTLHFCRWGDLIEFSVVYYLQPDRGSEGAYKYIYIFSRYRLQVRVSFNTAVSQSGTIAKRIVEADGDNCLSRNTDCAGTEPLEVFTIILRGVHRDPDVHAIDPLPCCTPRCVCTLCRHRGSAWTVRGIREERWSSLKDRKVTAKRTKRIVHQSASSL